MSKKETNSFKFFSNFLDAINMLPENERATACYEFCKYGITGVLPEDKSLAMFCIGVSVSVQKYQGRGGNNNPTGINQYSKAEVNEVKRGQSGQRGQYEQTETETETEACIKENNIKEKLVELSNSLKTENKNSVVISSEFKASDYEQLMPYVRQMPDDVIKSVECWIVKTKLGKRVDMNFIAKQFTNFATRQGKPFFKEGV